MEEIKSRYYSVKEIKQLEHCGKDKAYKIARNLPHEKRGKAIFVFVEDYEIYYNEKRNKAKSEDSIENKSKSNVYKIRKLS